MPFTTMLGALDSRTVAPLLPHKGKNVCVNRSKIVFFRKVIWKHAYAVDRLAKKIKRMVKGNGTAVSFVSQTVRGSSAVQI